MKNEIKLQVIGLFISLLSAEIGIVYFSLKIGLPIAIIFLGTFAGVDIALYGVFSEDIKRKP